MNYLHISHQQSLYLLFYSLLRYARYDFALVTRKTYKTIQLPLYGMEVWFHSFLTSALDRRLMVNMTPAIARWFSQTRRMGGRPSWSGRFLGEKKSLATFWELNKQSFAWSCPRGEDPVLGIHAEGFTSLQRSAFCFKHVQKLNKDVAVVALLLGAFFSFHKTPALAWPLYDVTDVFKLQTSMSPDR